MKKHLLISILLYLLAFTSLSAQNDTISGWTIWADGDTSVYANIGLENNFRYFLGADDDTSSNWRDAQRTITFTDGETSYAAVAAGWDGGADIKQWSIKFKAENFTDIKVSSKQSSASTNPGPRDWKIQAKIDEDWIDVPGGTITVANDWTTGVADALELPNDFDNPETNSIKIRWIMTSNMDINNTEVLSTGEAIIDEIVITGTSTVSGLEDVIYINATLYPNPAQDYFVVQSTSAIENIRVYNAVGAAVMDINPASNHAIVPVNTLKAGIYFVEIREAGKQNNTLEKLIIE